MLTFERTENMNKIYEITDIRGMRVEITPYRKTNCCPSVKTARAGNILNLIATKIPDVSNVLGSIVQCNAKNPKKLNLNAITVGKIILQTIDDVL